MKLFGKELKYNGYDVLHKGDFNPSTDNVATATKLQTARTITIDGEVKGSATFDGSGNITIDTKANYNRMIAMSIALA